MESPQTAEYFNTVEGYKGWVTQYNISHWKRQEKGWRTQVISGDINGTTRRIQAVRFPTLKAALGHWVQGHEALGHIVTGPLIIEKGKQIAKHLSISEDSISFSPGWLASFKE